MRWRWFFFASCTPCPTLRSLPEGEGHVTLVICSTNVSVPSPSAASFVTGLCIYYSLRLIILPLFIWFCWNYNLNLSLPWGSLVPLDVSPTYPPRTGTSSPFFPFPLRTIHGDLAPQTHGLASCMHVSFILASQRSSRNNLCCTFLFGTILQSEAIDGF